jgi:hypothetical protein
VDCGAITGHVMALFLPTTEFRHAMVVIRRSGRPHGLRTAAEPRPDRWQLALVNN